MLNAQQGKLNLTETADPAESKADALPREVLQIIGVISRCNGVENAITAKRIGEEIGVSDRKVRHYIERHIQDFPFMLCAAPGKGYFATHDPDDLTHWKQTQWSTISAMFAHMKSYDLLARKHGYETEGGGSQARYVKR